MTSRSTEYDNYLISQLPEYCGIVDEEHIIENGFDLLFAFDEVCLTTDFLSFSHSLSLSHMKVVAIGYRENVTLSQIRTFTDMDSHEEKIHEMVELNKEREAKEEMKRKMKELERDRRERERLGRMGGPRGGFALFILLFDS